MYGMQDDYEKRGQENKDHLELDLISRIRCLIRLYHDDTLPVHVREEAFRKINDLTKQLS